MIKPLKIHSAYNPQKEAERFCSSIKTNPKIILITEPGESYLAPVFRSKFPKAKLIAIRYTDTYFLESDKFWDAVWRPSKGNLEFFLISNIPDEFLLATVFLPWKPAEKVWPEAADKTWKSISSAVKIIQSVIATRNFFGKRWYKNIINNFLFVKNISNFEFENEDSFLVAAGPSLPNSLDKILQAQNNRLDNKFILAVASATPALLARNIKPNLCISTDGGFWAANHLKNFPSDIPIAFPAEANIPLKILNENPCVFLTYDSLLEEYFLNEFKISSKKAKRNGSVSGTATDLLLDYSKGNIYIAGLDLQGSKGFAHAQPYESQKTHELNFNKLNPVANFAAVSNLDCRSLKTYAQWFSQIPISRSKRIFRIGNSGYKIDNIKIINENEFILNSKNYSGQKASAESENISVAEKKQAILKFYSNMKNEIDSGEFLRKFEDSLMQNKTSTLAESTIEKELCELIAFTDSIQLIKVLFSGEELSEENKTKEIKDKEKALKNELSDFVDSQIKRLAND